MAKLISIGSTRSLSIVLRLYVMTRKDDDDDDSAGKIAPALVGKDVRQHGSAFPNLSSVGGD